VAVVVDGLVLHKELAGLAVVLLVLTLTLGLIILLNKKANYRLFKLTKRAYTFKWLAWLAEALFFPLLINLV
jgi:hypothetical protein